MKNYFTRLAKQVVLAAFALASLPLQAQLSAPKVENVYGGRVLSIAGYSKSADTTRLYISTESANSLFYSDIYNPAGPGFYFTQWNKVPSADADNNLGGNLQQLGVHPLTGTLYCASNRGLIAVHPDSSNFHIIDSNNINALCVKDSVLIYVTGNQLIWGRLDAHGRFIRNMAAPKMLTLFVNQILIHPVSQIVYFFQRMGMGPQISKSNHPFFDLKNTTIINSVSMGVLPPNTQFSGMGISPSGRIMLGGFTSPGAPDKTIRYTDNEITWTNVVSPNTTNGVSGTNFAFAGSLGSYVSYHSDGYSNNKGANWFELGRIARTTHPNDGEVFADPNDTNVVYFTSDLGISVSLNQGPNSFDIENGLEAVQVQDFDMTPDKQTAWIASKAGIRKVSKYKSGPVWSLPFWPNGDGSPYYSVAMKQTDTNTVYAGNLRIYKSNNGGTNWTQVFTPETPPYFFPSVGTVAEAIEIAYFNSDIVFAGFSVQDSAKGGLFYSMNAGASWSQILLEGSSIGKDVDVTDIAFVIEGTDTIAYVTVSYDLSAPQGRSVYRVLKSGSAWIASQNMNAAHTSTGTIIVASLEDVLVSSTKDTIYLTGTDAGINHPIAYYKIISGTNKWTPMTTSGFPFVSGKKGKAIALGGDTVFCAVDADIYMYIWGSTSWIKGYSYPVGTQINFLYYDELLAGTSTGLYGHLTQGKTQTKCYVNKNVNGKICGNASFTWNGKEYNQAGNFTDTLKMSVPACDTIYQISIIKLALSIISKGDTACFGNEVLLPDDSKIIATTSFIDTFAFVSQNGCDSLVVYNLQVIKIEPKVITTTDGLESQFTAGSYQWLNCNNGFSALPGANSFQYKPSTNGLYAVEITYVGCKDTSDCVAFTSVGLNQINNAEWLVYPNPANNQVSIETAYKGKIKTIVLDIFGREMYENFGQSKLMVNLEDWPSGLYTIVIADEWGNTKKVLFVKE